MVPGQDAQPPGIDGQAEGEPVLQGEVGDDRLPGLGAGKGDGRGLAPQVVFEAVVHLALARERLGPLGVEVVQAIEGLERPMAFPDGAFGLVINRHTGYNVREVERVLRPGGVFLTQQVDGLSLADLTAAFGDEPPWPFFNLAFALERVAETSLVVDEAREWEGVTTFGDVGALVYFVKAIPWLVPSGFGVATHAEHLLRLQRRLEAEGQLTFATKRLMLRAHRPAG